MDIGPSEIILVLVVLLLVFGGAKIPQIARNLGKAQAEFKRGLAGDDAAEPTHDDVPVDGAGADGVPPQR